MNEQTASSTAEPNPITGWLRDIFSIDTRSLAALRIGLGLIIVWEALANFIWLRWYFTEDGPTPSSVFAYGIMKWQSVYFASTGLAWTYSMFALQAILGLLLILGWRTRIVTVWNFLGRFSVLRAVWEVWNRLMAGTAGIIGKIPLLPLRTAVRGPGWGETILVSLIVVFVSAVNLRNMFPSVIGRLFPGAFPNLKQSWGVMDIPWQRRVRLLVEATCADGSTVMLVAPSPHQFSPRWHDYLWAPEHSRLLAMQNRLMGRVLTVPQDRPPMELFCAGHRRRWDETHPPSMRVVSLRATRESRNISPVSVAGAEDGPPRQLQLYEWQATPDSTGKSTFVQLR